MIVISDSSPLIALAKIGQLQVLHSLFDTIHIPTEVERELSVNGPEQGVRDILALMHDWLIVRSPASLKSFPGLHAGESAAISLAMEQDSRLLIDEKSGRKVAVAQGITVIGTIGVLLEAAERGLLDLAEAFARLKTTNFRFPAAELDLILEQFQTRRSGDAT